MISYDCQPHEQHTEQALQYISNIYILYNHMYSISRGSAVLYTYTSTRYSPVCVVKRELRRVGQQLELLLVLRVRIRQGPVGSE